MTEYRRIVDSSAWLKYFISAEPRISKIINEDDNILYTSAISLYEVKKKLIFAKEDPGMISESLDFIKGNSIVLDVSEEILEKSAEDSVSLGLSLADAVIYRSGLEASAELVTFDKDFSGRKGAIVMK